MLANIVGFYSNEQCFTSILAAVDRAIVLICLAVGALDEIYDQNEELLCSTADTNLKTQRTFTSVPEPWHGMAKIVAELTNALVHQIFV